MIIKLIMISKVKSMGNKSILSVQNFNFFFFLVIPIEEEKKEWC